MPRTSTILAVGLFLLTVPQITLHAQSDKEAASSPGKSIKREDLRFEDRSFDEWKRDLLTELSTKRRLKALTAMRSFAANGYAAEASAAVMEIIGTYEINRLGKGSDEEVGTIIDAADLVLRTAGEEAGPILQRALEGKQANRLHYALSLVERWPQDSDMSFAVAALFRLARDKDSDVSEQALAILGSRSQTKGVIEAFARLLKEGDRERVLDQLKGSNVDITPLVAQIETLSSDRDESIRARAIALLASQLKTKNVADAFLRLLQQGDRRLVLTILARTSTELQHVVPMMEKLAQHKDEEVRKTALTILGKNPLDQGAMPALLRLFKDGDESRRVAILDLFPEYSPQRENEPRDINAVYFEPKVTACAVPLYLLALQASESNVRLKALSRKALRLRNDDEVEKQLQPALAKLLMDPEESIRIRASRSLSERCDPSRKCSAIPELVGQVRGLSSPKEVRIRAINILNTIKADDKDVVAAIEKAAEDNNQEVQKAANAFKALRILRQDEERRKSED
jgi:HEAT repeat protein